MPGLDNSRVEDGVRNGLHLLVFAVFAAILFERLKFSKTIVIVTVTIVAAATIGTLSELLQFAAGRQPDIFDVIRDVTGAALALVACLLWSKSDESGRSQLMMRAGRVAAVVTGLLIAGPFLFWSSIVGLGRLSAPTILDFDQWWNKYTYRPINAEIALPGSVAGSVEILLDSSILSGLVISPMTTDWSHYQSLVVDAHMLKGTDANMTVRINDSRRRNSWSDEFLASIVVVPDRKQIRIPLSALLDEPGKPPIDLSDIQEIALFARDRRNGSILLIDEIRLD